MYVWGGCSIFQVQSATDQNPLALPWFTSKHVSPCTKCEDLWKVAWSAREDFLHDLAKAEKGKDYQLVASSGDSLRHVYTGTVFTREFCISCVVIVIMCRDYNFVFGVHGVDVGVCPSIFTVNSHQDLVYIL